MTFARVILWSISLLILGSLLATLIGLPLYTVAIAAALITALTIRRWHTLAALVPFLLLLAVFSAPFFLYHNGLPHR